MKVRPDDLLVVFFAGHGDLLTNAGRRLPVKADGRGFAADSGRFVFCCPNYSPATAGHHDRLGRGAIRLCSRTSTAASWCCSTPAMPGGAVEANLLRRCIPNGQGPVVIAACDQSEKSFEDDRLRHGMFTYAVLEALGPKFRAANRGLDGKLTAEELFAYVAERVPELMKIYRPGNTQNPICFPQPSALPARGDVHKVGHSLRECRDSRSESPTLEIPLMLRCLLALAACSAALHRPRGGRPAR